MADADHVRRLWEGIPAWNGWRKDNPSITPDLRGANLSGATLNQGNFCGTLLSGVNLSGAYGIGADFSEADLSDIEAEGACFSGAKFRRTKLARANLQSALFRYSTDLGLAWSGRDGTPRARLLRYGIACGVVWLLAVVTLLIWGQNGTVSMSRLFITAPGLSALLLCYACWPKPDRESHLVYAYSFLGYFFIHTLTLQNATELSFPLAVLDALKGLVVDNAGYGPWAHRILWVMVLFLVYGGWRGVRRARSNASPRGASLAPVFVYKCTGIVLAPAALYSLTALMLDAPFRPELTLLAPALYLWVHLGMLGHNLNRSAAFYGVDLSDARLNRADLAGTAFAPDTSESCWIKEDHPFSRHYTPEPLPPGVISSVSIPFPDPDYKVAAVYPNNLCGLDLRDACLESACFFDTVFDRVHLDGADFGQVHVDRVAFVDTDLATTAPPARREDDFDGPVGTTTQSNFAEGGQHYAQLAQSIDLRGACNIPPAWRDALGRTRAVEDDEALRQGVASSWKDLCRLFPFIEWARKRGMVDEDRFKDFVNQDVEPERFDVTTGSILQYFETAFPPAAEEAEVGEGT